MRRFVNGQELELPESAVVVERLSDRLVVRTDEGVHSALVIRQGDAVLVSFKGRQYTVERTSQRKRGAEAVGSGVIAAPMPGIIVAVQASAGDRVSKGHTVIVLEAMKTQQVFAAPFDAVVESMNVQKGSQVTEGQVLAILKNPADNGECVG